jgi:large-conductance mechanosensitive channel
MASPQRALVDTVGCLPNQEIKSNMILSQGYDNIITIVSVILFVSILYFAYSFGDKTGLIYEMSSTLKKSSSPLTATLVCTVFIISVISSLQINIITPLVEALFPEHVTWKKPVILREYNTMKNGIPVLTQVQMYPGNLLQSIITFIISMAIVYFIFKIFRFISKGPVKNIPVMIYPIIVMLLLLSILIWNIVDRFQLKPISVCVDKDTV